MNFDSLLDTLTNVVGFLVILMVLLQLDVDSAVHRIFGALVDPEKATPQALEQVEQRVAELTERRQRLSQRRDELEQRIAEARDQIDDLDEPPPAQVDETPAPTAEQVDAARLQTLEYRKQTDELDKQRQKLLADLASLQARADTTPRPELYLPRVITVPNPRAAPKGARPLLYICRYGQIAPVDLDELKEVAMARITKGGFEPDRVVELFDEKSNVGDRYIRLGLAVENRIAQMVLHYRKDSGESTERLQRSSSNFRRSLFLLDKEQFYVRFHVWPDSFDTYLEARKIVDKQGLMAGWEPYLPDQPWQISLGAQARLKVPDEPEPKPKPAVKPPPKPEPKPPPKPEAKPEAKAEVKPPAKPVPPKPRTPPPPVPIDQID
jgi:hypothetical protein